ncbi:MAG TPA: SagB/ThcOx family dehydrogenase [bacterium]|nr:SagB/ThcOx family dehydrogenase [bacterium]
MIRSIRLLLPVVLLLPALAQAASPGDILFAPPDLTRTTTLMQALADRASVREWSARELDRRDLGDLLWAANGINRPAEHKYTAASAQNAHDIDLYCFFRDGIYRYDADSHALRFVRAGDFRGELMLAPPARPADSGVAAPPPPSAPPLQIMLVADTARFRFGPPELRPEWSAIDAGIVSQNIALFCAAVGLTTRPRASMDKAKVRELLGLRDTQLVLLNHPVGYARE